MIALRVRFEVRLGLNYPLTVLINSIITATPAQSYAILYRRVLGEHIRHDMNKRGPRSCRSHVRVSIRDYS